MCRTATAALVAALALLSHAATAQETAAAIAAQDAAAPVAAEAEDAAAGDEPGAPSEPPGSAFRYDLAARNLAGLQAEVATLLLTGEQGGELQVAPLVLPLAEEGGEVAVVLVVEVAGQGLLQGAEGDVLHLEIYAYALDGAAVVGHLAQTVRLDLDEIGPLLAAGGVKFVGRLDLPPGEFPLKILVRERVSRRFALRNVAVRVPASRTYLLPPVVAEREGEWLLVQQDPDTEGPTADALLTDLCGCLPAALPVVSTAEPLELDLVARRAPRGGLEPEIELIDLSGAPRGRIEAELLERTPTGLEELERFRVRLSLSVDDSATYALSPRLDSLTGFDLEGPPLLAFLTPEPASAPPVWASLNREAMEARRTVRREGRARGGRAGRLVRQVAGRYLDALSAAVDRSWDEALAAVREMEESVVEERGEGAYALLGRAQRGVAGRVAEGDPEALLPLILLHADLHDLYVEDNEFLLSSHAYDNAAAVLALYAEAIAAEGAPEGARELAATAATHLGTVLVSLNLVRPGRQMLQRALELDPQQAGALVQLATSHETFGDYPRAVELLRQLVERDPKAPEGRLRLAVNLARTGRGGEAMQILERLISERNPDWVLTVAYQELGRLHLRQGRPGRAVRVLGDGTSRLPEQPSLWIAYSHALERAGQGRRSGDAALAALVERQTAGTSPRARYNRVAVELADRRQLEQAIRLRLPILARVLSEGGGR